MTDKKTYTVAEANALLPYLAPALVELREKYEQAEQVRSEVVAIASRNGHAADRPEWAALMARVQELVEKLAEWGVELKDLATGLVDFPAVIEDEEAYLCWRLGEPEVAYWHTLEGGFAGRRPL